jgi:hypothetical protein
VQNPPLDLIENVASGLRMTPAERSALHVLSRGQDPPMPPAAPGGSGLALLDWPAGELLQHGRQRIVYGISLVTNLLPYLLGADEQPGYVFELRADDDVERISGWWIQRWLAHRIQSEDVLAEVARHPADRPVTHGARVTLPMLEEQEDALF